MIKRNLFQELKQGIEEITHHHKKKNRGEELSGQLHRLRTRYSLREAEITKGGRKITSDENNVIK